MRVLLVHNFYRSSAPSGEDAVFHNECELLRAHGHEVITYTRSNDDIDETSLPKRVRLALAGAWSEVSYRDIADLISRVRPDVAHFHNTFPLISPSAYAACQDHGVPVVQTLHNYRLICAGALLQRNGQPCEDCVGTNLVPALLHRCYRGSFSATSAVVWMLGRNRLRGSYRQLVNRYIALTRFAADRLIAGGLPRHRLRVKPNFLPCPPAVGNGTGGYVVYVGRLSAEKGLRTLVSAWNRVRHVPLKIVGAGELLDELRAQARSQALPVDFLGFMPRDQVLRIVADAALLVLPSEWYEGFPMVALEAYAMGTPILASRIGSLQEIVKDGVTGAQFTPGDAADLAAKVAWLYGDASRLSALRIVARAEFEAEYTAERNHRMLLDIYEGAISDMAQTAPTKHAARQRP
jgi:glycosyltransferase involved in cell wall biosynthesis